MELRSFGVLSIICLLVDFSHQQETNPKVAIRQGTLVGKFMTSRLNNRFSAFQGIPFAAPPIGNFRFRDPVNHRGWKGERMAQEEGSVCLQLMRGQIMGSEDCLFLNVYTPNVTASNLSVMVWIHGGGLTTGSGNSDIYGPQYLIDQNVILVTLNYRLGMLGFLNTGIPELHGNYGLKDNLAALKWVQQNIMAFGGNPKSVTLFGWSSGSASVNFLLLSPLSRGLFQRAILESGSALNSWAFQPNGAEIGARAVADLGCGSGEAALECLRKTEPKKFLDEAAVVAAREWHRDGFTVSQEPNYTASPVLPKNPLNLRIMDVPVMTGVMTQEALLNLIFLRPLEIEKEFGERRFYYVPYDLGLKRNSSEFEDAWMQIRNFYKALPLDEMKQYLAMASDAEYAVGVDQLVRSEVAKRRRSPIYYYQFSYEGSISLIKSQLMPPNMSGSAHGDELGYLFSRNGVDWKNLTAKDLSTIDKLTTMWANFAKKGNPTPDSGLGVKWIPVKRNNIRDPSAVHTQYMDIGENLTMRNESLNSQRMQFWSKLYRSQGFATRPSGNMLADRIRGKILHINLFRNRQKRVR
ncbi:esterase E4-like [Neocloeon triangulifer]|uniref:esterase E4-like n=1 Tax=Neocloeon triangulifer TaxID=2078957 RepID=UPI00286F6819|nr:esterase E4-like [Neocloeon triangulifer]